jgi:hypothetical protein
MQRCIAIHQVSAWSKNAGKTATALAAGDAHSCALLTTGSIVCWGANQFGQLGNGNTVDIGTLPAHMGTNMKEVDLMAGTLHKHIWLLRCFDIPVSLKFIMDAVVIPQKCFQFKYIKYIPL